MRHAYRIFIGKPENKRQFEILKHGLKNRRIVLKWILEKWCVKG
jgi:hypothetical protein